MYCATTGFVFCSIEEFTMCNIISAFAYFLNNSFSIKSRNLTFEKALPIALRCVFTKGYVNVPSIAGQKSIVI